MAIKEGDWVLIKDTSTANSVCPSWIGTTKQIYKIYPSEDFVYAIKGEKGQDDCWWLTNLDVEPTDPPKIPKLSLPSSKDEWF